MDKKLLNIAETILNGIGITVSVTDLNNILNIILLVISILSILVRASISIYNHYKEKKYNEIANDLEKTKDEIETIINKEDKKDGKI